MGEEQEAPRRSGCEGRVHEEEGGRWHSRRRRAQDLLVLEEGSRIIEEEVEEESDERLMICGVLACRIFFVSSKCNRRSNRGVYCTASCSIGPYFCVLGDPELQVETGGFILVIQHEAHMTMRHIVFFFKASILD